MNKHFCTCTNTKCTKHPSNHHHGCDPCIKSNLVQKKMPGCFFQVVHDDIGEDTDFTIEGFVDFFQAHKDEYLKKKEGRE